MVNEQCKKECQPYLSQEALNKVPDEPMEVELREDQEPLEVKEDDLQQLPQVEITIDTATNLTSISRVALDSEDGFRTLLKDIEDNKKSEAMAINQLMSYCHMFLNVNILNYINSGEHINIGKCLVQVLDRCNQLNEDQVCGAVAAVVALNGPCWPAAQSILRDSFVSHENL
jgi:hypothetical protein